MHTGGVAEWMNRTHPEAPLYLVHAAKDGQETAYNETKQLQQVIYPDTSLRHPALMFIRRAQKTVKVKLPWDPERNIFIAGSHFIPDVWPALRQSKKAPGATRVVYIHHIVQEMPRPKSLQTLLANLQEKFCFSLIRNDFDKIITVNQAVIDSLRQRNFRQPILLSSNFVDNNQTPPVSLNQKDITIIFCGRLVKQKGIDDFLLACEIMQPKIPGFKAVMIGAGPEIKRLKAEIAAKQLSVEVTGFVDDAKKFNYLSRAQLFLFPSIEEGWGIAIAESLSVGTPVLAYRLPVYTEPFGAFIQTAPLGHAEELIHKALAMLDLYAKDPPAYSTLQEKIIKHAKTFSRDAVAAKEYAFITENT
jgi:glycosyltransferase involved in cell wall biosynthesis